jgi:hypothetical protein
MPLLSHSLFIALAPQKVKSASCQVLLSGGEKELKQRALRQSTEKGVHSIGFLPVVRGRGRKGHEALVASDNQDLCKTVYCCVRAANLALFCRDGGATMRKQLTDVVHVLHVQSDIVCPGLLRRLKQSCHSSCASALTHRTNKHGDSQGTLGKLSRLATAFETRAHSQQVKRLLELHACRLSGRAQGT